MESYLEIIPEELLIEILSYLPGFELEQLRLNKSFLMIDVNIKMFISIMNKIGFDMIKYYADINYRHETDISEIENIVDNNDACLIYSGCWYTGYFYEWLLPCNSFISVDKIYPNNIIHCDYESNMEEHHFFIITTDNKMYLFNTFGGTPELIINILDIEVGNELLKEIIIGNIKSFEQFFGMKPNYKKYKFNSLELRECNNYLPSLYIREYMKEKVIELYQNAWTKEDQDEIFLMFKNID